jgi:hypothetical protein
VFVQAALLAQDYCDAIDLNLGCPQMIAKRGELFHVPMLTPTQTNTECWALKCGIQDHSGGIWVWVGHGEVWSLPLILVAAETSKFFPQCFLL